MFLHKWTLQVSRQGQNEELSFPTKEEALREADKLFASASQEDPVTLILVDPDNKRVIISDGKEHRRMAASV